MNKKFAARAAAVLAGVTLAITALAGCGYSSDYEERKEQNNTDVIDGESLSRQNQEERLAREENEAQIRYVYIFPLAASKPLGYFTVNGKVSDAGVQNAPEQDIICRYSGDSCQTVDSAKDDGTFGPSEDGFFFFNTDDILIEGEGFAYFQSDSPIALYADVPLIEPAQLQQ